MVGWRGLLPWLALWALSTGSSGAYKVEKYSIAMPNVKPASEELYLCTPIKIDHQKSYFIVGFEPNATMHTAHHMLLFGCSSPGSKLPVWNCGEMSRATTGDMPSASPCGSGTQIIYAWALDAPKLELPDEVGFQVGQNSNIDYLVLQVHYHLSPEKVGQPDSSGLLLHFTERPLTKLAGVYLLGTSGSIAPHATEHMETSCQIEEDKVIHPFAYRTHTHKLGKVVAGYKVSVDKNGINQWTLLGKRNPMTPQMFYPIENEVAIQKGDTLAARCTMVSDRDDYTKIGMTFNDEMCNFYLMYYVENGKPLSSKYCFTPGPPSYYWNLAGLNNIPDREASLL
ncbi:peptidylglycine alpha-hydroxylating monooxygenase isoform X3 [Neocloeon triangulifer]|uniref:peptidylglycine alpha-hydroxylating monooxygenase isoform X3 n=1 Tax=Neocloeon triangulifer TaxID=2078957 RepID=UPI00286F02A3|nr:peptidylglycine alpha-hydroxylating monooxygenase isoform X3 [Neocloeon triangulifer]